MGTVGEPCQNSEHWRVLWKPPEEVQRTPRFLIWRTVGSPPPHYCPSRGQWAGLTILARLCAA
eukprot:3449563-Pyramimonas_sp.AAC.1